MSKIVLNNIYKNPVAQLPDWFVDDLKNLFSSHNFQMINETSEMRAALKDADYIIGWGFPKTFIKKNNKLKSIFLFSSQIPESLLNQDYTVNNITGLNSEYVVNYVLNVLKNVNGNKSILIMGKGAIGSLLSEKLKDHKTTIITRNPNDASEVDYSKLAYSLSEADIIIPTVSLNQATKELFTKDGFFSHLKNDVFLLNIARGELFDENDLYNFFSKNPYAFYHTDVTYPEPYPADGILKKLENCKITPHIAGFGEGLWEKILTRIKKTTQDWI